MNDIAAGYKADTFFKNLQEIQTKMSSELEGLFDKKCNSRVTSV